MPQAQKKKRKDDYRPAVVTIVRVKDMDVSILLKLIEEGQRIKEAAAKTGA